MLLKLLSGLALGAVVLQSSSGFAQDFPSKPITIVVPYGAGGSLDTQTRLIADAIEPLLGAVINVENRPGAGGQVGTEYVARQPADGYTLMAMSNSLPLMPVKPDVENTIVETLKSGGHLQ